MNCTHCEERMSDYLENALSAGDRWTSARSLPRRFPFDRVQPVGIIECILNVWPAHGWAVQPVRRLEAPWWVRGSLCKLLKNIAAGDILLLHDGNAARTVTGVPVILEVLPSLLEAIKAANLQMVTLKSTL